MGSTTKQRQKFLKENPICAFCGGKASATTVEHCPPKAMFKDRLWPEGFNFPACLECNNGTTDHDLIIAMLARMGPIDRNGIEDGAFEGLVKSVNKQNPGLLSKMAPSPIEARRSNRKLGIKPAKGQTHQEAGAMKVPDEFHAAVCVLATKLVKGIYYRDTRKVFPDIGCLLMNWFTNVELFKEGKYTVFEVLRELEGDVPVLERTGKYLNDQFQLKISLAPTNDYVAIQALFGPAFGFVVFGSTLAGQLESIVHRLRTQTMREGPLLVLQSPTLK